MNINEFLPKDFKKVLNINKYINNDINNSIISCGYINKTKFLLKESDINIRFNYYGALLLLNGTGLYEDEFGRKIPLKPGSYVQRLPGVLHSTIVDLDSNWIESYICFGNGLYETLLNLGFISKDKPVLFPGLEVDILNKLLSFYNKLNNTANENVKYLIPDILNIVKTINIYDSFSSSSNNENLKLKFDNYIENSDGYTINIKDAANYFNYSYESFRKTFTILTGVSPGKYIIIKRIEKAKDLLGNKLIKVESISKELHYPDLFSFTKQFKKYTKMTPTEFRKNIYI